MGVEENKETVRKLYQEIVPTGEYDCLDEFILEDVIENEAVPGTAPGREGFKQTMLGFLSSFPDMNIEVLDLIGEGDKVVARLKFSGTQENDFLGVSATGNEIEFESIDIIRFENGMIAEHWGCSDMLGFMQQLNAIPATETLVG